MVRRPARDWLPRKGAARARRQRFGRGALLKLVTAHHREVDGSGADPAAPQLEPAAAPSPIWLMTCAYQEVSSQIQQFQSWFGGAAIERTRRTQPGRGDQPAARDARARRTSSTGSGIARWKLHPAWLDVREDRDDAATTAPERFSDEYAAPDLQYQNEGRVPTRTRSRARHRQVRVQGGHERGNGERVGIHWLGAASAARWALPRGRQRRWMRLRAGKAPPSP